MIRQPRPAIAALAGLVLIVAGACSSSGTTTAPGGSSAVPGATLASGAATAAATAAANDASTIISEAISGGTAIKSFHIKVELTGTIKAAALSGAAGGASSGLTGDLKLDGTTIEGDVDGVNQAAHLTAAVPALPQMGNVPISADLIVKDGVLYYKTTLTGPKYSKMPLDSLAGSLPAALPTPGASAMTGVQGEIAALRKQLDDAGVKATLVGVEPIGGKDANHINVSIPLDKINSAIAAEASSVPGAKIDSASFDAWIYKADNRLAKMELKGASSAIGSLDFTITITNYDQPVTIAAPAAADISAAAP